VVDEGRRPTILDRDLWDRVQQRLEDHFAAKTPRRDADSAIEPSLLTGIVFDAHSESMTPTPAMKKGTRHRYDISRRLLTGAAADNSHGQRVPASNLEALMIGRLRALLRSRRNPECAGPPEANRQRDEVHRRWRCECGSTGYDHDPAPGAGSENRQANIRAVLSAP
jgi:hypothetical protein